jgi:hypothetical protein
VLKLKKVVSLGKFDVLVELAVATQPTAKNPLPPSICWQNSIFFRYVYIFSKELKKYKLLVLCYQIM